MELFLQSLLFSSVLNGLKCHSRLKWLAKEIQAYAKLLWSFKKTFLICFTMYSGACRQLLSSQFSIAFEKFRVSCGKGV